MTSKKPYTISQLCKDFSRTSTTIGRKIKKYKFEKEKNYVNGRLVNIVYLTEEEYSALKTEIELVDESITSLSETNLNNSELDQPSERLGGNSGEARNSGPEVTSLVQEVIKLSQLVQDQSNASKELIDRVINAEKKVLLLTDSERRKEDDYNRVLAENKELRAKLEQPWFARIFGKNK